MGRRGRRPGKVEVGSWIKVYWDGDDTWYNAEVTELDRVTECCKVLYEDGEREEFRLSDVKYRKFCGVKLREKYQADAAGGFVKKHLRYIHRTLLDMGMSVYCEAFFACSKLECDQIVAQFGSVFHS